MNTVTTWKPIQAGAGRDERNAASAVNPTSGNIALPAYARARRRLPYKAAGVDVKKNYRLHMQIGVILSLVLAITMFRIPLQIDTTFDVPVLEQEVVQLEEIQQTKQEMKAPRPERPPVPIEVPNDVVIDDEELELDVTLDFEEELIDLTPPAMPEPEEEGRDDAMEIFVVVEEMPEIIGGAAKLYEYVVYPEIAKKANIEGTVVVGFVVEPDGTPGEIFVMKSVHQLLDDAAVDAIRQLRFKPGRQRGRAVRVKMAIPIRFRLN